MRKANTSIAHAQKVVQTCSGSEPRSEICEMGSGWKLAYLIKEPSTCSARVTAQYKMYAYLASLLLLLSTLVPVETFSCSPMLNIMKNCNVPREFLNFVVFVPLPDEDYDSAFDQGYSIIPAVELAVDQINRGTC